MKRYVTKRVVIGRQRVRKGWKLKKVRRTKSSLTEWFNERERRKNPILIRYRQASYFELEKMCDKGDKDACRELQLRDMAKDIRGENITDALRRIYNK